MAWKHGVKSLYYCRSRSIQRAESAESAENSPDLFRKPCAFRRMTRPRLPLAAVAATVSATSKDETYDESNKYEECLACQ